MKKLPSYLLLVAICLVIVACKNSAFKGFDKMDNGAYMQFHVVNKQGDKPKIGDHVFVSFSESLGDSLIYASDMDEDANELVVFEPQFVGDMMAALMNMHVGDSATVAFLVDSMCLKTLDMDAVPDYLIPGMPVYIDIRLDSIIDAEVVAAQYAEMLRVLKQENEDRLAMYYSDENNTITNDGLVIMDVKGKGRGPKEGEILLMNFNMISLLGDTLLDMFNREPVSVICGDTELGEGFAEALRYVPEGGEGHFVVPSSLAFDSVGFRDYILPYTSFVLNVKNSEILTVSEYEQREKDMKAKEDAENLKRLEEEPERIAKFVKDHNVNVAPSATGVYYLEIQAGTGVSVEDGDLVSINYNMYNIDDKLIESSYGVEPLAFVYGNNQMVPGIEEALKNMRVGGKATIIVPSTMGFGDVAIDKELPANSTVVFDLELVDVQKSR